MKILAPQIHFVAGKGGVGKTTVAHALAQVFARNYKTLLVELSENYHEQPINLPSNIQHISVNLSYIKIYPDQAIYEYLSLKIPSKKIITTITSNHFFQALCRAMPGLSDLTRLGKIWYHADVQHGSDQTFQKIVVDMPSSGFVPRFLTVASVVKNAVKIGPLAEQAASIDNYVKKHSILHIVALPEELVTNETLELAREIKSKTKIILGGVFINRVFTDEIPKLSIAQEKALPSTAEIFSKYVTQKASETAQCARLASLNLFKETIVIADLVMDGPTVENMAHELFKNHRV